MVFPERMMRVARPAIRTSVMLYSGSRTYTFRLENREIVQPNKDKVWGMSLIINRSPNLRAPREGGPS